MNENKKMRIEAEFDRDEVASIMSLYGKNLTDESWNALTDTPTSIDFDRLGSNRTSLKIVMITSALGL